MSADLQIILLSLKVAGAATLILLPAGTFLGWLLARKEFAGKSLVDGIVNIPLVLPPVVTGYFLLVVFSPNGLIGRFLDLQLTFTWKAAALAAALVSLPLMVRSVHVAVESVDAELENAARMLRASEWKIFFTITLPLSVSGIVAGAVLAFARALGEFGATVVFASNIPGKTQTMPLAIFTYLNQPGGEEKARGLVIVSILLAYASVLVSTFLLKRLRNAPRTRH